MLFIVYLSESLLV